jgi:Ca-activated chloride channel family protein
MSFLKIALTLFVFLFFFSLVAQKEQQQKIRILFVFDASNSMKGIYNGKTKMEHAKFLFNSLVDSLSRFKNYEFALRMYGSTVKYPPGDCNDSKLIVPFSKGNVSTIKSKVALAKPTGITPIEHSLVMSANDFPDKKAINTIILITDGVEECKGDPCAARQKLLEKGIVFKPCIIGIGLTELQAKTFDCVGNYFSYEENNEVVGNVVELVSNQQLLKTTVQVNLLDVSQKPSETNVNMTFYDEKKLGAVYNMIHSINSIGNPDTITIDEFKTYKMTVHTIPSVNKSGITINSGTHNIIAMDAPQGYMNLKRDNGIYNFNEKLKCIIRKSSNSAIIHVQPINTKEKFIIGDYDIEVLTLPRTYFKQVSIQQSFTKILQIENAGQLKVKYFEKGDGCILQEKGNELKWVIDLDDKTEQIFQLQPGNYRITYRAKSLKQSVYTIERKFSIRSDQQTEVLLMK